MNHAHLAYFAQDLIGDALVWVNQAWMLDTILVKRWQRLCETTIFCTKGVAELFRCFKLFHRVVEYDPAVPWSAEEARGFGHFDLVANSRYDADSAARVEVPADGAACCCLFDFVAGRGPARDGGENGEVGPRIGAELVADARWSWPRTA